MRQPILTVAFALLAFSPTLDAAEPSTQSAIVDKAIAFHGGDLYEHSEVELDVCSRSGCFHIRSHRDGGLFDYEVRGKVRDHVRRVHWTNETLKIEKDGEPQTVAAKDEQAFKDWVNARIYFPFLPYRLNDPSVYKRDLGTETWGDKTLRKIKVTFEAGSSTDASDEYMYWFDPETGRLEQFAYSYEGNPGGLRFRQLINYRRIGGILFFDQQNLGAEGPGLSVDQITPEFAESMRKVSVVELKNIEVEAGER